MPFLQSHSYPFLHKAKLKPKDQTKLQLGTAVQDLKNIQNRKKKIYQKRVAFLIAILIARSSHSNKLNILHAGDWL